MIFKAAILRSRLLIRQKLGWLSFVLGCLAIFGSLVVASVSFVNPQRIYWDFALGIAFLLQIVLATFLGASLFSDESQRRTMHLVLSAGVSRRDWVVGNLLGIWGVLTTFSIMWWMLAQVVGTLFLSDDFNWMAFQAATIVPIESFLVLGLAMLFSLWVRPLIALLATAALVFLLHSADDLMRILTDAQAGRFVDDGMVSVMMRMTQWLPPLHWMDLRVLVGFESQIPWTTFLSLIGLGSAWCVVIVCGAIWSFERKDL